MPIQSNDMISTGLPSDYWVTLFGAAYAAANNITITTARNGTASHD